MNKEVLHLNKVNFHLAHIEKPILNKISYKVYEQDFIIILGSNGSGKSSLLKLIDKRISVDKNKIMLNGQDINLYSKANYAQKVKTLTQNCSDSLFLSLTVYENYLLTQKKIFCIHKKEKNFFKHYISQFNNKLALKLDQIVDGLSGGEKQSLILALTMLNPPALLLLDEHTSALDPKTAELNMKLTMEIIHKNKVTCLLTTHNLDIATRYGNRMLILRNGEMIANIEAEEKAKLNHELMYKNFY